MPPHTLVTAAFLASAAIAAAADTTIEFTPESSEPARSATVAYSPTPAEKPYLEKVDPAETGLNFWAADDKTLFFFPDTTEEEKKEIIARRAAQKKQLESYTLTGKAGRYVGWCGIVRKIKSTAGGRTHHLLLENKFQDYSTDPHIQVVSLYGGGDFTATATGSHPVLPPLHSLVAVYGKILNDAGGRPQVRADHIRVWKQGQFTFMDYGIDKTNPEWVKLRTLDGDLIYSPSPGPDYYIKRLGPLPTPD